MPSVGARGGEERRRYKGGSLAIERDNPLFAGSATTGQLKRRFPEAVEWPRRSNAIPNGTVLSTGTGILQPMDSGLEEGDGVTIACEIGELVNPVRMVY